VAKKSDTQVTRIKASGSAKTKKSESSKATSVKLAKVSEKAAKPKRKLWKPLASFLGYFKGAWVELRQVHWPTRAAAWSLTGAVLAFSAFFVVFILLLDVAFKYVFELILK